MESKISVHPILPISHLAAKYHYASRAAGCKLKKLQKVSEYYRPVKHDANTFFRAFSYSFLERLIIEGGKEFEELVQEYALPKQGASLEKGNSVSKKLGTGLKETADAAKSGKLHGLKRLLGCLEVEGVSEEVRFE